MGETSQVDANAASTTTSSGPVVGPQLIVGTGASGQLPITPELYQEAQRRGVEVVAVPTEEACGPLSDVGLRDAAAAIHVTC